MAVLIVIILILLVVALYPMMRDLLRRRQAAAPPYVEALQLLLDGRDREALARLKDAVAQNQNDVDAYIRLGDVLIRLGDPERGVKVHENLALRRNLTPGEDIKVLRALARDYLATGRKLKAISSLEELVHLDPKDRAAAHELLKLYIEAESWDKCERLVKEASHRQPDRVWAARLRAELGRALIAADPEAACAHLREALHLDRNSITARVFLGDCLMKRGETEGALRSWQEVVDIAPGKNACVRSRLEAAYYELGRYDEVLRLYEQLLRRVPEDEGLAVALAEIYRKREEPARAAQLLEGLGETGSRPAAMATRAAAALQLGQTDRARRLLDDLVNLLRPGEDTDI